MSSSQKDSNVDSGPQPGATEKSNPPMRYQFIDGSATNTVNLRQVKRHVMQEFVRQKKWREQHGQGIASQDVEENSAASKRRPQKRPRARKANRVGRSSTTKRPSGSTYPIAGRGKVKDHNTRLPIRPQRSGAGILQSHLNALESTPDIPIVSSFEWLDDAHTESSGYSSSTSGFGGYVYQGDVVSRGGRRLLPLQGLSTQEQPSAISLFRRSPTPQSVLSAARTDPFDTLPLQLDEEGKLLFDFYVNVLPASSYGFKRTPNSHNWYKSVFVPEAMKGSICFQNTILVHASKAQAWVRGLAETRSSLFHRAKGIQMLREHFAKYPNDISDAAISATLSAAALEDFDPRPERKPVSWIHMRAAIQMIRDRGGPLAFENNQRMAMLINWSDYIFSGYETNGPSFFYEHFPAESRNSPERSTPSNLALPSPPISADGSPSISSAELVRRPRSMPHSNPADMSLIPINEIRTQCEEFLDFLRRSEHLSLSQQASPNKHIFPARYTSFQPHTLLYRILSVPPGVRYSITGERKAIISRIAALMIINVALWDYRFSPRKAELFLVNLTRKLLDNEVDVNESVESLLQILLASDDTFGYGTDDYSDIFASRSSTTEQLSPTARPWFVGRMIKIAKRLGATSWDRLNRFLFSFLTLTVEMPVVLSWEEELRREILSAPLTSYIMPIMQ